MSYKTPVEFLQLSGVLERDFGYALVTWVPNPTGRYRPKVQRLGDSKCNNDVLVVIKQDKVYVKTYRQIVNKCEYQYYDYKTSNVSPPDDTMVIDSETPQEGISESFTKTWQSIIDIPDEDISKHPTMIEKNLIGVSGCRKILEYNKIKPQGGNAIIDAIFIPFQNADGDITGVQYRDSNGRKLSVPESQLHASFHVVQHGNIDPQMGGKIGLFAESYTTALELAEARPQDTVVCCAGQSVFHGVFQIVEKAFPDVYWVAALDKNKKKNKNLPQFGKTEMLIKDFKKAGIPNIIPNQSDFRFYDCTDFNDMALVDKGTTHQYVTSCLQQQLSLPPKVIGNVGGYFTIISSLDNTIRRISHEQAPKMIHHMAPLQFWASNDLETRTDIINFLMQQHILMSNIKVCGVGIHREGGATILNSRNGRYIYENGVIKPMASPSLYNNFYVDMGTDEKIPPATELDLDVYKRFKSSIQHIYKFTDGDILFLLGYFVHAAYAAHCPRRAHLWLTGASGSGKSTLIDERISKVFAGLFVLTEDVTEAWIRQELADDSTINTSPIISIDEVFDSASTRKKMQTLQLIMAMVRSAASNQDKVSGRGRADQNNSSLIKRFCAVLSSPTHHFDDLQDHSRFMLFDMNHSIKHASVEDFEAFNAHSEDLAPTMLNLLLTSVLDYESGFKSALKDIREVYGNRLSTLSHVDMGMAAVLTGAKIINEKLEGNMLTNKQLLNILKERFDYTVDECERFVIHENDPLHTSLYEMYVKTRFGVEKLYRTLITKNTKEEMFDIYGLRLCAPSSRCPRFGIEICKGFKKVNALIANPELTKNPIFDVGGQFKTGKSIDPKAYSRIEDKKAEKHFMKYRILFSEEESQAVHKYYNEFWSGDDE